MIRIENISKAFGEVIALKNISLEIPRTEKMVVLGPVGSGKSTLLRIIAGLEQPDSGSIFMENRLVSTADVLVPPYERNIGMVFQQSALWPHLTVEENIRFAIRNKSSSQSILDDISNRLKLSTLRKRYPKQLSGGEARRVAIARALASKPKYFLLDEPLSNLDPELRNDMLETVQEFTESIRSTLIYVTHHQEEVKKFNWRILIMRDGKLQE